MRRQLYRGRVVDLGLERITLPDGRAVELEIVRHRGAAAVAAVDQEGCVVLIRQYRAASGGYLWELPAGVLDDVDEGPLECARRELREEVGLLADEFVPLGRMLPTPGYSSEVVHLFLARGLHRVEMAREDDEIIAEVAHVPLAEALAMERRGEIIDAKTAVGLHRVAAGLGGST